MDYVLEVFATIAISKPEGAPRPPTPMPTQENIALIVAYERHLDASRKRAAESREAKRVRFRIKE